MTYQVMYHDDEGNDFVLAEEVNTSHAVVSALLSAQAYEAGEIYVEDEHGTVLFQCYPDGDDIRVLRKFTI